MWASPDVKSAVLGKIFGVGSLDVTVRPPRRRQGKRKNYLNDEVAEFVRWALTERLKEGVPGLVWSIYSGGLPDGYSVSEKVWGMQEKGAFKGKWPLFAVKPKDVGNDIILQTDSFKNIVGLMGLRYNGGKEFSPANFIVWRNLPLYDSPTGMSDLRAAYQDWWTLDAAKKLRAMFAEQRAGVYLLGTVREDSERKNLSQILQTASTRSWGVVPEGAKVQALDLAGSTEPVFRELCRDLQHNIVLSITGAILQAREGNVKNAAGNSQVHREGADLQVWFLSQSMETVFNDTATGLVPDLVDLNYLVDDYPRVTMSSVDVAELTSELTIDTGLIGIGVDLSQEEMRERYGRAAPEDPDDTLPGKAAESNARGSQSLDVDGDNPPGDGPRAGPNADARRKTIADNMAPEKHAEDAHKHEHDAAGRFATKGEGGEKPNPHEETHETWIGEDDDRETSHDDASQVLEDERNEGESELGEKHDKDDDKVSTKRDKEDTAREKAREKEDTTREKTRGKEDRDSEQADKASQKAFETRKKVRALEDKALSKKHAAENKAQVEQRNTNEDEINFSRESGEQEIEERRKGMHEKAEEKAEEKAGEGELVSPQMRARIDAHHDNLLAVHKGLHDEMDAAETARQEAEDAAQEKELADLEATREKEDSDEEDEDDARYAASDARDQARVEEDAALEKTRTAFDAALEASREQEDSEREKAHEKALAEHIDPIEAEQAKQESAHEAGKTAQYHARKQAHPEAHALYYSAEEHEKHSMAKHGEDFESKHPRAEGGEFGKKANGLSDTVKTRLLADHPSWTSTRPDAPEFHDAARRKIEDLVREVNNTHEDDVIFAPGEEEDAGTTFVGGQGGTIVSVETTPSGYLKLANNVMGGRVLEISPDLEQDERRLSVQYVSGVKIPRDQKDQVKQLVQRLKTEKRDRTLEEREWRKSRKAAKHGEDFESKHPRAEGGEFGKKGTPGTKKRKKRESPPGPGHYAPALRQSHDTLFAAGQKYEKEEGHSRISRALDEARYALLGSSPLGTPAPYDAAKDRVRLQADTPINLLRRYLKRASDANSFHHGAGSLFSVGMKMGGLNLLPEIKALSDEEKARLEQRVAAVEGERRKTFQAANAAADELKRRTPQAKHPITPENLSRAVLVQFWKRGAGTNEDPVAKHQASALLNVFTPGDVLGLDSARVYLMPEGLDADDLERIGEAASVSIQPLDPTDRWWKEESTQPTRELWNLSKAPEQVSVSDVPDSARFKTDDESVLPREEEKWDPQKVDRYKRLSPGLYLKTRALTDREIDDGKTVPPELVSAKTVPSLIAIRKDLLDTFDEYGELLNP
jgi:hypothetical protein